jgi:hypothetical protein
MEISGAERHAHIAELFTTHQLELGNSELAQELDARLSLLPWSVTSILWHQIDGCAVTDLDKLETNEREMAAFLTVSGFAKCPVAAALLTPTEPPILGAPAVVFSHLDEMFWKYPGPRFVFGCTKSSEPPKPVANVLAQYGGTGELTYIENER